MLWDYVEENLWEKEATPALCAVGASCGEFLLHRENFSIRQESALLHQRIRLEKQSTFLDGSSLFRTIEILDFTQF